MPRLKLTRPLTNACGTGSYPDIFEEIESKGAFFGAYVIKSVGPCSRDETLRKKYGWIAEKTGNPNPTVVYTGHVFLNSMDLPTHSIESWIGELEKTKLRAPIIGSVWGNNPEDYKQLISMIDRYVVAHQINISCPNKQAGEKSLMETMTSQLSSIFSGLRNVTEKPIMAKLSPNEDYVSAAKILRDNNFADYIICGNTVGPGLIIDIHSRKPVLAGNYGGMSGSAMKPKIMKMVNDVYGAVKGSGIEIAASGGIECWEDIIEYAIAGASVFETGTSCFVKVNKDRTAVGRSSGEIAKFTRDLWDGVEKFLAQENTTLDRLVGSMVKNG